LLKIHNIWVKKAREAYETNARAYIRDKLLKIAFFNKLTFEEFNKICQRAELHLLGPGEVLVEEDATPYHMYIITEGELSL
jgi:signal-transduction protein with cAMP-binding, CBS, and nucleotidyltransferase domain